LKFEKVGAGNKPGSV